ncbi:MAG: F0F1 ATP synthase subunit epsilon, partial [Pseudomonadota bacterium]
MADAFTFELVSPERLLLSEEVTEVVVPGTDGYFTVMANHAPTMSTLQPGVATVKTSAGKQEEYVIFGGFI